MLPLPGSRYAWTGASMTSQPTNTVSGSVILGISFGNRTLGRLGTGPRNLCGQSGTRLTLGLTEADNQDTVFATRGPEGPKEAGCLCTHRSASSPKADRAGRPRPRPDE